MHDTEFEVTKIDWMAGYIKKAAELSVPLNRKWYTEFNETRAIEANIVKE